MLERMLNPLNPGPAATRKGRILTDGSPDFTFSNSAAIPASGIYAINLESNGEYGHSIVKYLPLDFLEIINDSSERVGIVLNGDEGTELPLLANSHRLLTLRKYSSIRIINRGVDDVAANELRLLAKREPMDADKAAYRAERQRQL